MGYRILDRGDILFYSITKRCQFSITILFQKSIQLPRFISH